MGRRDHRDGVPISGSAQGSAPVREEAVVEDVQPQRPVVAPDPRRAVRASGLPLPDHPVEPALVPLVLRRREIRRVHHLSIVPLDKPKDAQRPPGRRPAAAAAAGRASEPAAAEAGSGGVRGAHREQLGEARMNIRPIFSSRPSRSRIVGCGPAAVGTPMSASSVPMKSRAGFFNSRIVPEQ